jgi:phosphoribosylformylglycinamidine synthase subunit PurL
MLEASEVIDFSELSTDEVARFLESHRLHLTVAEVLTIQNTLLNRPPTFSELVLWSIQGSEHCSYKSSRVHLKSLPTTGPDVILGAKEDAGIVAIATDHAGKRYGLVVSHESHNHPSQIVPYEGAATGVGGNVRDVCCMGAEVIAIADSLRFGDLSRPATHWIHHGVVSGIAGYGNPIGVPNLAGDLYYHPGYNDNCLVTIVTLGVVREEDIIHSYAPSDAENHVFILVGKPTDNSGFGGASFASSALDHASTLNKGAIQEPNAFLQRHLLKANYALFEYLKKENLIERVGFKDLGAGGIACASVELAEAGGYGAEIDLNCVPITDATLAPAVILCAETQERFMWVVPESIAPILLAHYNETFALPVVSSGACARIIGRIRTDGQYVVRVNGQCIVDAPASAITKGIVYDRPHHARAITAQEPQLPQPTDYRAILLSLLAHQNIASRAPVLETYDKQVQGRTFIEAGYADAGVLQPFNDERYPTEIQQTGVALSLDHNP